MRTLSIQEKMLVVIKRLLGTVENAMVSSTVLKKTSTLSDHTLNNLNMVNLSVIIASAERFKKSHQAQLIQLL